ncbi:MAG: 4-hydroxybenzoate octaprenyltransferase [Rhodospirillaceae bacterium]
MPRSDRPEGFTDIRYDGRLERWTPAAFHPYLRLARLDRPIGTWLLLFPCWWSLALASPGWPDRHWLGLALLFGIGAVVMRGAGCTVNDILDRDLDARVERTRARPIPSGQVAVAQALVFMAGQMLLGLVVLLQLTPTAIGLGVASLLLVFTYPLMKRITWWPQAFLGLAFNWGALMGWAAAQDRVALPALALYGAGIAWTLGYDTIYAHQDKEDDARIGVKSTARRLGERSRVWIAGFYFVTIAGIAAAGWLAGLNPLFPLGLVLAALQLAWQLRGWIMQDPADCLLRFKSNRWFGWLVLAAIVAGNLPFGR